jgi:antitoxin (DNA-binding transcriptional repressor) of toxin-antitoxin stability system
MIAEYNPLTQFRKSLTPLCRAVQAGKKEVIVTFHQQPVFKVVKLKNDEIEPSIPERSFVQIVRNQSEFLDAIELYDVVILTARNKRLARCEKI